MTNTDSPLDELLINGWYLKDVPISESPPHSAGSMKVITPKPETIKKLELYCHKQVIEARNEGRRLELQNINFVLPPSPELFKYTKKRMSKLRKTL